MKNNQFNYNQLSGRMKRLKGEPQYYYTIGIDDTGYVKSYCLMRNKVGGSSEILLTKVKDEKEYGYSPRAVKTPFEIEVENLAGYFNATIYKEHK